MLRISVVACAPNTKVVPATDLSMNAEICGRHYFGAVLVFHEKKRRKSMTLSLAIQSYKAGSESRAYFNNKLFIIEIDYEKFCHTRNNYY